MRRCLHLLALLLLAACATNQPVDKAPVPTQQEAPVMSQPAVVATTVTLPPTLSPTFLPTNTPEPSPTPTPIPPPTGRVYFLWDPLSRPDGLPDPIHNLYIAVPGATPNDWEIETVLTELVGIPVVTLSPDKTKLAFTALEDANNDGHVSFQGAAHYLDIPNVFVYSLIDNELERITDDFPWARSLTWSNDSQRLAYQSGTDVYVATHPTIGEPELLYSFPTEVQELAWSPNGNYLAVGTYGGEIYLLNTRTNLLTTLNLKKQASNLTWSPDSQFLVSNEYIGVGLYVLDIASLSTIELVESDFFSEPHWSPNSLYLVFTQGFRTGIGLPLSSSLSLWDTENRDSRSLTEAYSNLHTLWSPNSQNIILGFLDEEQGKLMLFDVINNTFSILLNLPDSIEIRPLTWSPDGQWLLFYSKNSNESGLSLIHQTGGEVFQVVDTTNTYLPYGVFWLSE